MRCAVMIYEEVRKNVILHSIKMTRRPSDCAKEGVCMQIKLVYAVSFDNLL